MLQKSSPIAKKEWKQQHCTLILFTTAFPSTLHRQNTEKCVCVCMCIWSETNKHEKIPSYPERWFQKSFYSITICTTFLYSTTEASVKRFFLSPAFWLCKIEQPLGALLLNKRGKSFTIFLRDAASSRISPCDRCIKLLYVLLLVLLNVSKYVSLRCVRKSNHRVRMRSIFGRFWENSNGQLSHITSGGTRTRWRWEGKLSHPG